LLRTARYRQEATSLNVQQAVEIHGNVILRGAATKNLLSRIVDSRAKADPSLRSG